MSVTLEARVVELEAALKTAELRSVISGKYAEWMERALASDDRATALLEAARAVIAGHDREYYANVQ